MGAATRAASRPTGTGSSGSTSATPRWSPTSARPTGGRRRSAVGELAGGAIDGLVTWAGVAGLTEGPRAASSCRSTTSGRSRSSTACARCWPRATVPPPSPSAPTPRPASRSVPLDVVEACLAGDEPAARAAGDAAGALGDLPGHQDGHRPVGPPPRAVHRRVGRRRHHPQRRRPRRGRDARCSRPQPRRPDDRRARRRVPDPGGPQGHRRRARRVRRVPARTRRPVLLRLGPVRRRRHRRPAPRRCLAHAHGPVGRLTPARWGSAEPLGPPPLAEPPAGWSTGAGPGGPGPGWSRTGGRRR